jgi:hypothetical protein
MMSQKTHFPLWKMGAWTWRYEARKPKSALRFVFVG